MGKRFNVTGLCVPQKHYFRACGWRLCLDLSLSVTASLQARTGTHDLSGNAGLWKQLKEGLKARPRSAWYGNLYTKGIAAASAADVPFAEKMERAYLKWRKGCGLSEYSSE